MKGIIQFPKVILLLFFLAATSPASADICESCQGDIAGSQFEVLTSYDGSFSKKVCYNCIDYAPQCFVCKLPSYKGSALSDDKRVFCSRDHHAAIFAHDGMNQLAYQTVNDLNRAFYRFKMDFAISNVTVSLVSSATLYDLLKLRFNPQQAGIVGLTMTKCFDGEDKEVKLDERHKQPEGTQLRYEHEVYVANGFPEDRIKAVIAHELAHVWVHENLPFERANMIDSDTIEGFCELVAYQMVANDNAVHVRSAIRRNLYTAGQQNILIEIESGYGFNRLLQWLYKGTNRRLQNADLVRQVSDAPLPKRNSVVPKPLQTTNTVTAQTNSVPLPVVAATQPLPPSAPKPATVVLKGIFFGKNRSALVNDLTLGEGEEHQLKLAEELLGIKCIEIKATSVILAVNGETKEYFVGRPAIPMTSSGTK